MQLRSPCCTVPQYRLHAKPCPVAEAWQMAPVRGGPRDSSRASRHLPKHAENTSTRDRDHPKIRGASSARQTTTCLAAAARHGPETDCPTRSEPQTAARKCSTQLRVRVGDRHSTGRAENSRSDRESAGECEVRVPENTGQWSLRDHSEHGSASRWQDR